MFSSAVFIPVYISSCLGQFIIESNMKPDVTFGEHNDRFDVSQIVREQNRLMKKALEAEASDFRRSYRRNVVRNVIPILSMKDEKANDNKDDNVKTGCSKALDENAKVKPNNEGEVNDGDDVAATDMAIVDELIHALKYTATDFAHHENTIDNTAIHEESGNHGDYEKNLEPFMAKNVKENDVEIRRNLESLVKQLHGGIDTPSTQSKGGRRGMPPNPEDEILFHYGVPVNMKVEGFLQVPMEKS